MVTSFEACSRLNHKYLFYNNAFLVSKDMSFFFCDLEISGWPKKNCLSYVSFFASDCSICDINGIFDGREKLSQNVFFPSKKSMPSLNTDRSNPSSSTFLMMITLLLGRPIEMTHVRLNIDHNQYVVPSIITILKYV